MFDNVFEDFPKVFFIWVLPALIITKILFYFWYKINKNTSTVDVGYVVNHFVAATVYFIYFESYKEW